MRIRPRRNRRNQLIRDMFEESMVRKEQLVYPLFLEDGNNIKIEIASMPGIYRWSKDTVAKEIEECLEAGIKRFILFPNVADELKDSTGSYGVREDNFYLEIVRALKEEYRDILLISDVALDPYSSDGHDGIVKNGMIINDETVEVLQKMSVVQANAGFDMIGPSDMMDGRVGAIRDALDEAGHKDTSIISYTAKYASAYYGPFRDALDSAPKGGDKKTYQMNPANSIEALREMDLDEMEGADVLMVKPALCYLDIIADLASESTLPIAAYNVSGEYAMIKAAAANGWLDEKMARDEALLSIARAGASVIITYFAKSYAQDHG